MRRGYILNCERDTVPVPTHGNFHIKNMKRDQIGLLEFLVEYKIR